MKTSAVIDNKLQQLPDSPGCYIYRDKAGKVLYVGKARVLKNRVRNYFQQTGKLEPKIQLMVPMIHDIETVTTDSELEALLLETNLIKKYRPKYNKLMKDDKNYVWLLFETKEDFPRIRIVREKKLKGEYLGPYPNTLPLKRILAQLRKVFPYRTCNRKIKQQSINIVNGKKVINVESSDNKPCLYFYLGLCKAPCAGFTDKNTYRSNIHAIKRFMGSEKNDLINDFKKQMQVFASSKNFEAAASIRDKINDLNYISQRININEYTDESIFLKEKQQRRQNSLFELAERLKEIDLQIHEQFKIECYDISNIQGSNAVGAMVVFVDGRPARNLYRKFRIKTKDTPDDFEMMREVLRRRFNIDAKKQNDESFKIMPDLVIVDGGKGQLSAAYKILSEMNIDLPIVGLAKRFEELFLVEDKDGELDFVKRTLRSGSESKFLVQRIRDETHRFAITYHRKLRAIASRHSVLDDIPGVGPVIKHKLLKAFGSIDGIKKASDQAVGEILKNKTTLSRLRKAL